MKKMCDCSKGLKGIKNTTLLYFIVFLSTINIIWFFYYNFHSILIFFTCCLAIYLITKNMIYVLGISLFVTDLMYLINKKLNYEGFDEKDNLENEINGSSTNMESSNMNDIKQIIKHNIGIDLSYNKYMQNTKIDLSGNKYMQNIGTDLSYNEYMQNKNIINKLKELNPNVLNTIENMNSTHIEEINKIINKIINKQPDP